MGFPCAQYLNLGRERKLTPGRRTHCPVYCRGRLDNDTTLGRWRSFTPMHIWRDNAGFSDLGGKIAATQGLTKYLVAIAPLHVRPPDEPFPKFHTGRCPRATVEWRGAEWLQHTAFLIPHNQLTLCSYRVFNFHNFHLFMWLVRVSPSAYPSHPPPGASQLLELSGGRHPSLAQSTRRPFAQRGGGSYETSLAIPVPLLKCGLDVCVALPLVIFRAYILSIRWVSWG